MADIDDHRAARAVDDLSAVFVPDVDALRPVGERPTLDVSGEISATPGLKPRRLGARTLEFLATRRKPAT